MTDGTFKIGPIGHVRSTRREAIDDNWDAEQATIMLARMPKTTSQIMLVTM